MKFPLFEGLDSLVYALLHTLWQGGLIVLLLSALLYRVPARRARLRYFLSVLALAAILSAGVFTWAWLDVSPHRTVLLLPETSPAPQTGLGGAAGHGSPVAEAGTHAPQRVPEAGRGSLPWIPCLAAFWACGVAVFLGRSLVAILGTERLCRQSREIGDAGVLAMAAEIRSLLGIKRRVRLLVTEHGGLPAALGMLRPAVIVPASLLTGLPPEYLRAVLVHELAHIRQWDYLINIGQMLLESLLFFNPFVWWVSRQVRREREACCDLVAASHCRTPGLYFEAVLACVRRAGGDGGLPAAALAMGGPGKQRDRTVLDRAKRLLLPGYRPAVGVPRLTMAASMAIGGGVLFLMLQGARLAAEILTPQQRMDRITEIRKEFDPVPEQGNVTVSGQVLDSEGRPISGEVEVEVSSWYRPPGGSGTGGGSRLARVVDGRFSSPTHAGVVRVAAWAKGYSLTFLGPLKPGEASLENLKLVLPKGLPATVKIVDEQGKPLEGARIKGRFTGVAEMGKLAATTDARGVATLEDAGNTAARLEVTAAGYQFDRLPEQYLDAKKPLEWRLKPARLTTGHVVSARTGEPIAKATIKWAAAEGGIPRFFNPDDAPLMAATGSDGGFVFDTLPDDSSSRFFVEADGYRSLVSQPVRAGEKAVLFKLGDLLFVRGKVVNAPPEASEWKLSYRQVLPSTSQACYYRHQVVRLKNGTGSFEIAPLYQAPLEIWVGPKRFGPNKFDIPTVTAPVEDYVIDLNTKGTQGTGRKRSILIRLKTPENAALPRGTLRIHYEDGTRGFGGGRSAASKILKVDHGEASLEMPVPNKIDLETDELIGYWAPSKWNLTIPEGEGPYEIDLPTRPAGAIYGKVLEEDGSPAQGYGVWVNPITGPERFNIFRHINTQKEFALSSVPLGSDYLLMVSREHSFVFREPLPLNAETPFQNVTVTIPQGTTVGGRVIDSDGRPVSGLSLHLELRYRNSTHFGRAVSTDADGRFAIPHVNFQVPGSYSVRIADKRYLPAEAAVDSGKSTVELTARKGNPQASSHDFEGGGR